MSGSLVLPINVKFDQTSGLLPSSLLSTAMHLARLDQDGLHLPTFARDVALSM